MTTALKRAVVIGAMLVFAGAAVAQSARGGVAQSARGGVAQSARGIIDALHLDAFCDMQAAQAEDRAQQIAEAVFHGGYGPGWRAQVAAIRARDRVCARFEAALGRHLAQQEGAALQAALARAGAPALRQAAGLLASGLLLPEEALAAAYQADRIRGAPALAAGEALTEALRADDLVLEARLVAALAFARAFAQAGGHGMALSEADLIADLWEQSPELEAEAGEAAARLGWLAVAGLSPEARADLLDLARDPALMPLRRAILGAMAEVLGDMAAEEGALAAPHARGQPL